MNRSFSMIGAGKVARSLLVALNDAGFKLNLLWNRSQPNDLNPEEYGGRWASDWEALRSEENWIIIAVSDDAIAFCSAKLPPTRALITHTSGVLGVEVLNGANRGVFYPLQTFHGLKPTSLMGVPILIDAESESPLNFLKAVASEIGGIPTQLTPVQKEKLHVAAVFANNYSNQMFRIAKSICDREGISWNLLHPLIEKTIENALEYGPESSQTGPALRGDIETLKKHLTRIDEADLKEIYKLLALLINPENREL